MKFTQGDFRRFCALFFLLTRKVLLVAEMLVLRERKKRVMPRHLMNAAIASGIIPYKLWKSMMTGQEHQKDYINQLKAEMKAISVS